MASLVLLLLLFSFFNERFIAPFISPSRQVSATPIVGSGSDIGPDNEIIIPKINLEVPVVYGSDTTSEDAIQKNLENGVVHYSTSAKPGENGNVVIVGHSSNNILNKGKYKFAFVLLKKLEIGDTFSLNQGGKRYTYQIYEKKIVKPTDVSVLGSAAKSNSATLITCDPPGTSLNRLIVIGTQISPDPSANPATTKQTPTLQSSGVLPGNSPSLWQRVKNWF
jgi:sortase A